MWDLVGNTEDGFSHNEAQILLVSEPFPDPNRSRPISMTGRRADDPFNMAPTANVEDPRTQRKENRNTPTENRFEHTGIDHNCP